MAFFGVQLNAQVNRLIGDIKLHLNKNKYLPNFRTIYRSFSQYDLQQSGIISHHHLDKVLQENSLFFKKFQIQVFQKAFDQNGNFNWFSFLSSLRQPLNQYRSQVLGNIYNELDPENNGQIHYSELSKQFNVKQFPQYKEGKKSKQKIQKQLLGLVPLTSEGYILKQQFINFYKDLSLNILSDMVFAKFVSSHWNHELKILPELKLQEVKEAIRIIRFKLIQKTGGTHEEFLLKQVFDEFDLNRNGSLCENQLHTMLIKLQIPTQQRLIKPLLKKLDRSKNGVVEFEEFKNFLFFDPYPI